MSANCNRSIPMLLALAAGATSATEHLMEEVEIVGRRTDISGQAVSASQGIVGQQELEVRPLLRTGEILEAAGLVDRNLLALRNEFRSHGKLFASIQIWSAHKPTGAAA